MQSFFYQIPQTLKKIFTGRNLLWQFFFWLLTALLVLSGFDWKYLEATRGDTIQIILFPAVIIGFLLPVFGALALFLAGFLSKSKRMQNTAFAVSQAGILGWIVSSTYKVFTGRFGPPHWTSRALIDTSHAFHFGVYRGGAFQGWPSSHTTVAFAMSVALITLYPQNKLLRYAALIYALYIGIGVSVNIHWFSDFAAGMILGSVIGYVVGKAFYDRYRVRTEGSR